jgi:hypothetical protein
MAIYKLIQNTPFGRDEMQRRVAAYEETLRALGLKQRDDPITRIVAKKVFEIAQTGIEDPAAISKLAIKELGIRWAPGRDSASLQTHEDTGIAAAEVTAFRDP